MSADGLSIAQPSVIQRLEGVALFFDRRQHQIPQLHAFLVADERRELAIESQRQALFSLRSTMDDEKGMRPITVPTCMPRFAQHFLINSAGRYTDAASA
jgi:hypothetical protein